MRKEKVCGFFIQGIHFCWGQGKDIRHAKSVFYIQNYYAKIPLWSSGLRCLVSLYIFNRNSEERSSSIFSIEVTAAFYKTTRSRKPEKHNQEKRTCFCRAWSLGRICDYQDVKIRGRFHPVDSPATGLQKGDSS